MESSSDSHRGRKQPEPCLTSASVHNIVSIPFTKHQLACFREPVFSARITTQKSAKAVNVKPKPSLDSRAQGRMTKTETRTPLDLI